MCVREREGEQSGVNGKTFCEIKLKTFTSLCVSGAYFHFIMSVFIHLLFSLSLPSINIYFFLALSGGGEEQRLHEAIKTFVSITKRKKLNCLNVIFI